MVAFIGSFVLTVVMVVAVLVYARRRPIGAPLSWGEAMVAATFAFFAMFWAYGVVPHQWLTWADNELGWRSDALIAGPGSTGFAESLPLAVSKQVVRDLIAVVIYAVFLGMHVALWSIWQGRAKARAAKAAAAEIETTSYGRPLVRGS